MFIVPSKLHDLSKKLVLQDIADDDFDIEIYFNFENYQKPINNTDTHKHAYIYIYIHIKR